MSGYIGTQPVPQATQTRQTFTATASQTSFATAGYQAGYLDVYLNGVHLLNGTDYTATNGSDVVLTTGAASGDILEIVAYSAFEVVDQNFTGTTTTDNLTVTGAFTSQGIDDNASSTAMTLDASGNLLVNRSAAFTTAKTEIQSDAGDPLTLALNSIDSDGNILSFYKAGNTVGSIGTTTDNSRFRVLDGSNRGFVVRTDGGETALEPSTTTAQNGYGSLGTSGARWKDLYLSGGVYLGGTGAANYLDDYETGTWTPTAGDGFDAGTGADGRYVKVGDLVLVSGQITGLSGSGGGSYCAILNLPFNVMAYTANPLLYAGTIQTGCSSNHYSNTPYYRTSNSVWIRSNTDNSFLQGNEVAESSALTFAFTYRTA
jgi:hypothetical protein